MLALHVEKGQAAQKEAQLRCTFIDELKGLKARSRSHPSDLIVCVGVALCAPGGVRAMRSASQSIADGDR